MFNLKKIIFNFFGRRDWINDVNKDANSKGLNQRFNELLAEDLDENEIELINNLVENTQNPYTCLDRFIPYHEQALGMPVFVPDIPNRRKFIALIKKINPMKGTKPGYSLLLQMLGFTSINFVEHTSISGFDSPVTFDDPNRFFDQKCKGCSDYEIHLTGGLTITSSIIQSILTIINYNEPINAKLLKVTYNGLPLITNQPITIYIDQHGNLIFINPYDPTFTAWIDSNGNLFFQSSFAQLYSINSNGDLILNI